MYIDMSTRRSFIKPLVRANEIYQSDQKHAIFDILAYICWIDLVFGIEWIVFDSLEKICWGRFKMFSIAIMYVFFRGER